MSKLLDSLNDLAITPSVTTLSAILAELFKIGLYEGGVNGIRTKQ